GEARIALNRKHPGSLKLVHCLPALFTFSVCLLVISSFFCRLFLVPLIIYALLLFVDAMFRNKCDLRVGSLSVIASFTQLFGYGTGFLRSII
ncbi:glycosyl transferase family 2, partial [Parabacteroides distasonis]